MKQRIRLRIIGKKWENGFGMQAPELFLFWRSSSSCIFRWGMV